MTQRLFTCTLLALSCLLVSVDSVQARVLEHSNQSEVLGFLESYHPAVVQGGSQLGFADLMAQLQSKRVVFIGETHDRYDHHLNQLAVLRAMHQQNPLVGVGVEWFQQHFQPVLDRYMAGQISEAEMLRQTGYHQRWRYDYRMLRPIVEFAKANRLPLIALNVPTEITTKVAHGGLASLTPEERAQIPTHITPPDMPYVERLRRVFADHSPQKVRFENFAMVQRLWDETMAANVLKFLRAAPTYRMVVFSGSGHVGHGEGIPADVARSIPAQQLATLHSSDGRDMPPGVDYLLATPLLTLPSTGKLGVWLDPHEQGVRIGKLVGGSSAERVGLKQGDRISWLNGHPIQNLDDLLMVLSSYQPGQEVSLGIERTGRNVKAVRTVTFNLTLQ